jgi:hypothetical protein
LSDFRGFFFSKNVLPSPLIPPDLSLALLRAIREHDVASSDEALAASLVLILRQAHPDQKPHLIKSFHVLLTTVLSVMYSLWSNRKENGCTSVLMGRCFGHSLCSGIDSLSDCAIVGSTLCRLAPLLNKDLFRDNVEKKKSDAAEKGSVRWRCTVEVRHLPHTKEEEQHLQYFQFPDVSSFEDSILIEDDTEQFVAKQGVKVEHSVVAEVAKQLAVVEEAKQVDVPFSESVLERLERLESQLVAERKLRVALEARVQQLQEELLHYMQPKSPTQSLVQALHIGRQRAKSGSGHTSEVDTPELPPRNPRVAIAKSTGSGHK